MDNLVTLYVGSVLVGVVLGYIWRRLISLMRRRGVLQTAIGVKDRWV